MPRRLRPWNPLFEPDMLRGKIDVGNTPSTPVSPTIYVYDDFDRANNTTDPGSPVGGTGWQVISSPPGAGASTTWGIISNTLYQSTDMTVNGDHLSAVRVQASVTSIDISIDITTAQTGNAVNAGILFRHNTLASDFFRFILSRSGAGTISWILQKRISGTYTSLASGTPGGLTGTLRVTDDGSEITCYINGVQVAQVTDTALNTENSQGIVVSYNVPTGAQSGSGWRFDNFLMIEFP